MNEGEAKTFVINRLDREFKLANIDGKALFEFIEVLYGIGYGICRLGEVYSEKPESTPFLTEVEAFTSDHDVRRLSLSECFVKFAQIIEKHKQDKPKMKDIKCEMSIEKPMTREEEIEETKRRG